MKPISTTLRHPFRPAFSNVGTGRGCGYRPAGNRVFHLVQEKNDNRAKPACTVIRFVL